MVAIIRHLRAPEARNAAPYRAPVLPNLVVRTKVQPEKKPEKLTVGPFIVRQTQYVGWTINKVGRPLETVAQTVCEVFDIPKVDLFSHRRHKFAARPRQAAYLLAREFTTKSFPDIGRFFGGRDHTTIMHGIRMARERREPEYQALLDEARRRLAEQMT